MSEHILSRQNTQWMQSLYRHRITRYNSHNNGIDMERLQKQNVCLFRCHICSDSNSGIYSHYVYIQ